MYPYQIADDVLHIFSKAGDNICIGRDKRQCGITLGVNAQGVSRVHLKLELRPDLSVSFFFKKLFIFRVFM